MFFSDSTRLSKCKLIPKDMNYKDEFKIEEANAKHDRLLFKLIFNWCDWLLLKDLMCQAYFPTTILAKIEYHLPSLEIHILNSNCCGKQNN